MADSPFSGILSEAKTIRKTKRDMRKSVPFPNAATEKTRLSAHTRMTVLVKTCANILPALMT
jgi:hypothetical protein